MDNQERGAPSLFTIPLIQFLVLVLLFIALLNGQRELIVLTLLVLGIVTGARLWARAGLVGLHCHLLIDKHRVFPGEKIALRVSAENAKLLPIWLELNVPIGNLLQDSSGASELSKATSLLWYERTQFDWGLAAERRGVYQVGPLHIQAGDLFSFFSRSKQSTESQFLIVYPRLVPLKSFSLPRRDFFGVPRATSPVQDPIYILGTRDYQHGQPSRYIHWKASARHNRLQQKVFEPTVQEKILLVVDVEPFAQRDAEEDWERMLELVASLAVRLDKQGHSVGLVTNSVVKGTSSSFVPVARNDQHLSALLELIARLEMKPNQDFKDVLRRGLAETWGITCVYFSYEDGATVYAANEYMYQRQTPVVFIVSQRRAPATPDRSSIQPKVYLLDDLRAEAANR